MRSVPIGSYYRTINGVKYDRALLDRAESYPEAVTQQQARDSGKASRPMELTFSVSLFVGFLPGPLGREGGSAHPFAHLTSPFPIPSSFTIFYKLGFIEPFHA